MYLLIRGATNLLCLFLCVNVTIGWNVDEVSKTLDQFLEINSQQILRAPRSSEDASTIWMEYEFNSGAGNREELIVTNISVHEFPRLPGTETNWQFLDANGTSYLFRTEESVLYLYEFDSDDVVIRDFASFDVKGTILTFKAIYLRSKGDAIVVLCVESNGRTSLRWYRLLSGNRFNFFWSWPIENRIKDMKFIQHEEPYKLLLLNDDEIHYGIQYSPVYVCRFEIDFSTNNFYHWLCQRTLMPKVLDLQLCPIYESMSLALHSANGVLFYKYRNTIERTIFEELQVVRSYDLNNFVCFESGYVQFLAISGPEAGLFHFVDGEFQFSTESEPSFDVSEISWVRSVRLDTYRDESLVLIQLKNSTVIALAWHGLRFKKIQLPSDILDQFDLSSITPLSNNGFIQGNRIVKLQVALKNVKHPNQYTTERLLVLQRLLNDSLYHQERILNETEARVKKSYLKNPEITGFWNISTVNVTDAVISDDVIYHSVTIGGKNLTKEDLSFDMNNYANRLEELEQKLDQIDSNLISVLDFNSTGLSLDSDIEIFGNINFTGNLNVGNLSVLFINGMSVTNSESHDAYHAIEGNNMFDSIEAENLTIHSLNGIPVETIGFREATVDYRNVDFTKINRAQVDGQLSFSTINNITWDTLMKNIVWKDEPASIPGNTIIEGTLVANICDVDRVNDLLYPEDYVLSKNDGSVIVTGSKTFDLVLAANLTNVVRLNDIDFEDFVVLYRDNVLKKRITFENLTIEGELRVDCEVTGSNLEENLLLNETSTISSDITFLNLNVLGNVTFDTLLINKLLVNLDDLLLRTDEKVEITGTKTFLGNVGMKSNVIIKSGMVNEHLLEEFVTLDTDQTFPNLTQISSDVTFGNVTLGAFETLEALFKENRNSSNCFEKIIVFQSPVIVDKLSFDRLNSNVSYEHFNRKLNETYENAIFENLIAETVEAKEITPETVNGQNFKNIVKNVTFPNIVDEYSIDRLETDLLNATFINGMSMDEINELIDRLNTVLHSILNGNVTLESLRVTGIIQTNLINGKVLNDLLEGSQANTAIFKQDVSIKNLTILGLMNNFNFSERLSDTILKTDRDIVISGYKIFNTINCHELEATSLNGRPIKNILNPFIEQVLKGPVIINGDMTIYKEFNVTGNIGDIPFYDFTNKFKALGNNTFELSGDVHFANNVTVNNFYTYELIQGRNFDSFLNTVVLKKQDNLTISGTKVFQNSVTFNDTFVVYDKLNDVDLKRFYRKAVFTDKPFSIKSKVTFKDDVLVEKVLAVQTSLEAHSVMGIDLNDLRFNLLYLNKPTYVAGSMTFTNVSFKSGIQVELFNDLDMKLLIPLNTEQVIPGEVLKCRNITVDKIQLYGKINNQNLHEIQQNTFMLHGNQNITGHFNFHGDVQIRRNFNARLINGIDSTKFIPLNSKSPIIGNFVFEKPVLINESLRVLGYLNDINPNRWEAVAVTANNLFHQIISGKWTVFGDVYFEKGASGSNILNGTNVAELSNSLAQRQLEMDTVLAKANENLDNTCEDLSYLKHFAEKQIYQFNVFDYLQMIDFNSSIISVHYFELDDLDYLMLSYNNCQMHTYLFTGTKFELINSVLDFGVVEQWTAFEHDRILYFLVSGTSSCGRSPVNLWKFQNDQFEHVLDLGRNADNKKISQDVFLMIIDAKKRMRSSENIIEKLRKSFPILSSDNNMKIVLDKDQMLLTNEHTVYEYNTDHFNDTSVGRYVRSPEILNFKAGIFEKEMHLYYDEEISKDRIFICNNDTNRKKILQTIKTHRPTSFTVLNFDGSLETMLVFIENKKILRIYEYKGIQGFVYRDSIRINVDKLFAFKIRRYTNLAKRYCLALLHDNRLTIVEAMMHGEKLDMAASMCSKY
ncbi:female sterile (1) Nasrat [Xylocopa sonorina]|uniref:female sterile (1) Nasrat n=1 Tax=Xylocopa sonorina TaxID=1818115 RepID=UPI00403AA3BB